MDILKIPNHNEKIIALRIYRSSRIGPKNYGQILKKAESFEHAFEIFYEGYKRAGMPADEIVSKDEAEREFEKGEEMGARLLFMGEAEFSEPLIASGVSPPFLWVKGNLGLLQKPIIAIVGARNSTPKGWQLAKDMAECLARHNITVASGLARGIDGAAHMGSAEIAGIGVAPGGIDVHYPRQNSNLYEQLMQNGLLISEMPIGYAPRAQSFPRRNRILAGISNGVVIIEAKAKSGTRLTAQDATDFGREVYAVPGHPFDPLSELPNALLRDGAILVQNGEDILGNLTIEPQFRVETNILQNVPSDQSNFASLGFAILDGKAKIDGNGQFYTVSSGNNSG